MIYRDVPFGFAQVWGWVVVTGVEVIMSRTPLELQFCCKWICEHGQNFQSRGQMKYIRTDQAYWIMKIGEVALEQIKKKRKHVEARIALGSINRVRAGDILRFQGRQNHVEVKVRSVVKYTCFSTMLAKEGLTNCLPDCVNMESGLDVYHSLPNYENMAKTNGVVAFRITTDLFSEPTTNGVMACRRMLENNDEKMPSDRALGSVQKRSRSRSRKLRSAAFPQKEVERDAVSSNVGWHQ